jgi:hypothetical protein
MSKVVGDVCRFSRRPCHDDVTVYMLGDLIAN